MTENTVSSNLTINLDSRYWDIDDILSNTFEVQVLKHEDSRILNSDSKTTKEKEVQGWIKRNIWAKAEKSEISGIVNIVGGRFIMSPKI